MATECTNILLQASLDVEGKVHLVTLTSSHLLWEAASSGRASDSPTSEPLFNRTRLNMWQEMIGVWSKGKETTSVDLREVIAVNPERTSINESRGRGSEICCVEMVPLRSNSFSVHCIRRLPKHKWRVQPVTFYCQDYCVCKIWVERLKTLISKEEYNRPKRLLVFVNPFGGKRRGQKLYQEKVAPLFELAGIYTEVIVTQRARHAYDVIQDCDLSRVDGLVCVGGDGMFSELLNGLLNRTHLYHNVPHSPEVLPPQPDLRIGIIPAGSTDTVVYSTVGNNDVTTSALHIIAGDSLGLDVCSVYHRETFITYNVSLLGYGYYGDVIMDSEQHRWMGPKRYDWCGFKKVMSNRSYDGEVSFLLSTDADNHPRDKSRCLAGCAVCSKALEDSLLQHKSSEDKQGAKFYHEKSRDATDGWHRVRGRFIAMNSMTMSCRCLKALDGPASSCHLGDGCSDLTLVFECSRLEYIRHLYRCADKKADQFDFPFIQVYRIKEFSFKPLFEETDDSELKSSKQKGRHKLPGASSHNSRWNCDGEVLDYPEIYAKVHCQLIKIFARGIEEVNSKDASQCPGSCLSCDKDNT